MPRTVGLLLAAGAGRRMGRPKARVVGAGDEPWVGSASRVLRDGGCDPVVVVVGAEAEAVRTLLRDADVRVVEASDWADGMGASLRTGLAAIDGDDAAAVLVHLVDLPDVGADVVARLVALGAPDVLARATYDETPGHPVLIGRDHWSGVAAVLAGDRGAQAYLRARDVVGVECGDLATGADVDEPGPMLG